MRQLPAGLLEYALELRAIETGWPKINFHALREHASGCFRSSQRLNRSPFAGLVYTFVVYTEFEYEEHHPQR